MDDGDESTLASLADVYCTGELLAAVQRAGIWPDSKDFVDTAIKAPFDADDVRRAWRARSDRDGRPMTDDEVREFVAEYFERGPERPVEGGEVDVDAARATLPDWDPDGPAFAHDIADPTLRDFARRVHALWPSLARQPPPASPDTKPRSTLLPSPRVAIVPGERFRETYYWDTHWTVLGLLASGMRRSASGVCENMLTLVDTHGFMPNGARVYYLNRSQPPVLASTVAAVCGVKGDCDYDAALATRALPTLISEWEYLTRPERTVRVRSRRDPSATHRMYRYWAYTDTPRPESWREDTDLIENQPPAVAKRISRDVASAAESGHDFGSRWLADAGTNEVPPGTTSDGDVAVDVASLRSIRTTRVVPADLNGFMLKTAVDISLMASAVGDGDAAARFEREAARIRVGDRGGALGRRRRVDGVTYFSATGMDVSETPETFPKTKRSGTIWGTSRASARLTGSPYGAAPSTPGVNTRLTRSMRCEPVAWFFRAVSRHHWRTPATSGTTPTRGRRWFTRFATDANGTAALRARRWRGTSPSGGCVGVRV